MKKLTIGYLGAGTWGSALANLLQEKGHHVKVWDRNQDLIEVLKKGDAHPKLKKRLFKGIEYKNSLEETVVDADLIVESVTSKGIRPVFEKLSKLKMNVPIVITSKGIEQHTGLLFPEVALDVLGQEYKNNISCITGPSHAEEVIEDFPTLVVSSSFDKNLLHHISQVFSSRNFRVYPNHDIYGVCFGGAMKNIIAIACSISDGLGFGDNTRAALITRGLHELKKLSVVKGCKKETLNGLSGLGDLLVTCTSKLSRNYRFGELLSKGYTMDEAQGKIGMVVEGVYTCVSGKELGQINNIPLPITEAVYGILYEGLSIEDAVENLLNRTIKEEHL